MQHCEQSSGDFRDAVESKIEKLSNLIERLISLAAVFLIPLKD